MATESFRTETIESFLVRVIITITSNKNPPADNIYIQQLLYTRDRFPPREKSLERINDLIRNFEIRPVASSHHAIYRKTRKGGENGVGNREFETKRGKVGNPSRLARPIVRLIGLHHVLYIMVVSKMRFNDI